MKVIAKKNRELALINAQNTQNENRAETITLVVPEEYEDYNKKIVFVTDDGIVWDIIQDNTYKLTKAITKYKQVDFYIWLTKGDVDFRSKTMPLRFYHNEDASDEITPEEISGVNTVVNILEEKITKVENLNIEATKIGSTTTVTITKKDGTTESVEINDGVDGQDGQDAKINGKNSIEIEAGNNITIDDTENGIRINSTGGGSGGTSNYNDLSNKPKINNVELSGNKSLNDLGIQPKGNYLISETDPTVPSYVKNITQANITNWNNKADISDIPDVSNFITRNVNNLVNYTLKTNTGSLIDLEINQTTYVVTLSLKDQDGNVISTDTIDLPLENVVVSGRYDNTTKKVILTLENGSEVDFSIADLVSGLQSEITSQNKLASDLIDDSNSGNKFVTSSEKQTWNNKLDTEDLTDYVKNTDYATNAKGGVIRTLDDYGTYIINGVLSAVNKNYAQYQVLPNQLFIGKGTLENVITGKELVNKTYVDNIVGDIESLLAEV